MILIIPHNWGEYWGILSLDGFIADHKVEKRLKSRLANQLNFPKIADYLVCRSRFSKQLALSNVLNALFGTNWLRCRKPIRTNPHTAISFYHLWHLYGFVHVLS